MKIRLLVLLLLAATLSAQRYYLRHYEALKETALAAAAEVVTIQQPATGSRTVYFKEAYVYCSVACTFTVERDGVAAAGTALTVLLLHAGNPATAVTAWHTSNVGAGTTVSPTYALGAGDYIIIDLTRFVLVGDGTAKNLTVRTNSITGTVRIAIIWEEIAE